MLTQVKRQFNLSSTGKSLDATHEPSALHLLAASEISDMPNLFSKLIELDSKVCAFHMQQEWIDIGTFETFERVSERFETH